MKFWRYIGVLCLSGFLTVFVIPALMSTPIMAQTQSDAQVALQKGYRTGYSDGYMAGYRDTIDSVARDYGKHDEYLSADRAYSKDYGLVDDYRDGYQQGFEAGYDTGFERRSFQSALPPEIKHRGVIKSPVTIETAATDRPAADQPGQYSDSTSQAPTAASQIPSSSPVVIPRDTELVLEMQDDLNTEQSREGQKFTARVVAPSEIAGATIEGHVAKIVKPNKLRRRSELSLSFDRILLSNDRWSNMSATMVEVMAVKGDNIKRVDVEGTAIGQDSIKSDAIKVGGATTAGLVTGAVIGGPVGAAVGAGVGAAFGVGAVVIERGKHIRINQNQQIRIKTAYETHIR